MKQLFTWANALRVAAVAFIAWVLPLFGDLMGAAKSWGEMREAPRVAFIQAADAERDFYMGMYDRYITLATDGSDPDFSVVRSAVFSRAEPGDALAQFPYGAGEGRCEDQCSPTLFCGKEKKDEQGQPAACRKSCKAQAACASRRARIEELKNFRRSFDSLVPVADRGQAQAEAETAAEASKARRAADGSVLVAAEPSAVEAAPAASVASVPISALTLADNAVSGWDVDVFWCGLDDGGPEAEVGRYAAAKRVAEDLAGVAKSGATLGGQTISRVRLRPLSAARNAQVGYQLKANQVRRESLAGQKRDEVALGQLLADRSGKLLGPSGQFTTYRSTQATPWYLSLFICEGARF